MSAGVSVPFGVSFHSAELLTVSPSTVVPSYLVKLRVRWKSGEPVHSIEARVKARSEAAALKEALAARVGKTGGRAVDMLAVDSITRE